MKKNIFIIKQLYSNGHFGINDSVRRFEKGVYQGYNDGYIAYGCDLLNATNSKITILQDTGSNVLYKEVNDLSGRTWAQCQIRIPLAGFYKVRLDAGLKVLTPTCSSFRSRS
jgi:hypothetical protein